MSVVRLQTDASTHRHKLVPILLRETQSVSSPVANVPVEKAALFRGELHSTRSNVLLCIQERFVYISPRRRYEIEFLEGAVRPQ